MTRKLRFFGNLPHPVFDLKKILKLTQKSKMSKRLLEKSFIKCQMALRFSPAKCHFCLQAKDFHLEWFLEETFSKQSDLLALTKEI